MIGMKKLVPRMRSTASITAPTKSAGKASSTRIVVTTMAHPVKAMRIRDRPRAQACSNDRTHFSPPMEKQILSGASEASIRRMQIPGHTEAPDEMADGGESDTPDH